MKNSINIEELKKREEYINQYRKKKLEYIDLEIKWGKRVLVCFMLFLVLLFIYKTFINPQV